MDSGEPTQRVFLDMCGRNPSKMQAGIWKKKLGSDVEFVDTIDGLEAYDIIVTERREQFPTTRAQVVDCLYMGERIDRKEGRSCPRQPSPAASRRSPSPSSLPCGSKPRPKPYTQKCTTQRMDAGFLLKRERVAAIMDRLKHTEKVAEQIEQHLASQPYLDVTTRKLLEDSVEHMLGNKFGATWVERRQSKMADAQAAKAAEATTEEDEAAIDVDSD